MPFSDRPPSTAWEAIPLPHDSGWTFWAWFKPASAPNAVCIRFPQENVTPKPLSLTMRQLAHSLGLADWEPMGWSIYGMMYGGGPAVNPGWDQPIPPAPAGADPTLAIYVGQQAQIAAPQAPTGGDSFSRMDADWNAALQLELQLDAAAKQLNATQLRINALNRDLSPDEFRAADQQERREWQEARRWMRDVCARVSRFLKEHHIGITSAAGKRNHYETIYRDNVVPRRPVEGMPQIEREFESYRKMLQSLLSNMQSAHAAAVQDGERRAQQVMSRISTRVRSARAKR